MDTIIDPKLGPEVKEAPKTPVLMKDCEGYFRLHKTTKSYRWRVNLYNSTGWVYFVDGEAVGYGIFLRTGRYSWKLGERTIPKYRYLLRFFEPEVEEDLSLYSTEGLEQFFAMWNPETRTGVRQVSLQKLKLSQYEASTASPVPLSDFYLGKYRSYYNPTWYGYGIRRNIQTEGEYRVKLHQKRCRRRSRKQRSLKTPVVEGLGSASAVRFARRAAPTGTGRTLSR